MFMSNQYPSAFCNTVPVVVTRGQNAACCPSSGFLTGRNVLSVPRQHGCLLRMSLTNELLFKALEVGAATAFGNSFVNGQTKENSKPNPFFSFKRKEREVVGFTSPNAKRLNELLNEVFKFGDMLPNIIEQGGAEGKKWVKLAICVAIDLVGSGSLGVPLIGDALDIVTAPVMAIMLQALFGNSLVTVGGFMEEILPGTDGIPTATLAWLAENYSILDKGKKRDSKGC